MRKRRAAYNETEGNMTEAVIPCYGGPYDGKFYPASKPPIGYRDFDVRKRKVFLWKVIKIERLDFQILEQASIMRPDDELETPFGEGL